MAAPHHHDAYEPPAQVKHQCTTDGTGPDPASHLQQRPTIKQSVYTFLHKVKSRFGEGSVEVTSIWNALGAFRDGRAPKKDTLTAIQHALGHHYDLEQALMNVLFHPAADWWPGDFDFESPSPNHLAIPDFLQPAHQPPIPWHEDRPGYTPLPLGYNQTWCSTFPNSVANHEESLVVNHPDISPRQPGSCLPQPAFWETLSSETTTLSSPSDPISVSADQLVENMLPPSRKRRYETLENQIPQHTVDQERLETAAQTGSPSTNTSQPVALSQQQSKSKRQRPQNEDRPKPYIHSLCGKGFAARCKVKKHHWGNVLDDLDTKTGCWAKHGKPKVNWDDHPSCKETTKVPTLARTASPIIQTDGESQEKPRTLPPTLPTPEEPRGAIIFTPNTRENYQDAPGDTNLHHSYQIPHRSGFDTLLEAANIASQIDAARLQGRTNSVTNQLYAQAAADRSVQYIENWQNVPGRHDGEAVARGYHHPYTTAGTDFLYPLRGHHVPLEVALPFCGRPQAHTPHMYSTTTGNSIVDPTSTLNDAHTTSSRALLPPFSPDPHVRSRSMQDK